MEKTPENQDVNDPKKIMGTFLQKKEDVDFTKATEENQGNESFKKIIVFEQNSRKRVAEKSEIRYQIQKYLFNPSENKFYLANKDGKNAVRAKLQEMKEEEKFIRKCLLTMSDDQIALFILPKKIDDLQYKICLNSLFNNELNEKRREEKRLESEKLKEQAKKAAEEGKNQEEIKLEEKKIEEKKAEEPNEKELNEKLVEYEKQFDGKVYFRIYIDLVISIKPGNPKTIGEMHSFVFQLNEDLRYYLNKGEIKEGITCANLVISNALKMSKALRKDYEDSKFKQFREKIDDVTATVLLNRFKLYFAKAKDQGNQQMVKIYEESLKPIEEMEEFFQKRDINKDREEKLKQELKFMVSYCLILIKMKKIEEYQDKINFMKKRYLELKDQQLFTDQLSYLEGQLALQKKEISVKAKKNLQIMTEKISDNRMAHVIQDYEWTSSMQEGELKEYLKNDIAQMDYSYKHLLNK